MVVFQNLDAGIHGPPNRWYFKIEMLESISCQIGQYSKIWIQRFKDRQIGPYQIGPYRVFLILDGILQEFMDRQIGSCFKIEMQRIQGPPRVVSVRI